MRRIHQAMIEPSAKPQRGAALIVSLIFLLIMTLLGVFALNTSTLETLMAGNNQYQTAALGDAELALASGEDDVEAVVSDTVALEFDTGGDHYYNSGDIDPNNLDWSGFVHNDVGDGQYVIEYGGSEPLPGSSTSLGTSTAYGGGVAGGDVFVFLVTARSESSKGAVRIVQSVYVTEEEP
jgi:type IV pilus assembly protein PilX